jgi:hypothetical protein
MLFLTRLFLLSMLVLNLHTLHAEITYLGEAQIPGTARDKSGLKGTDRDGKTPLDRLGGLGSAIAYTGKGNRYLLASDRGPRDGDSNFPCRIHEMDIVVDLKAKQPVTAKLMETNLLRDEKGKPFVGSLEALDRRLDPEGVRLGRDGSVYLSDEYGPFLWQFDRKGTVRKRLTVPDRFRPAKPGPTPRDELPPKNSRGRQPNRGLEGLAITPDGTKLLASLQSPLIPEGLDRDNKRVGLNARLLEVTLKDGSTRELVYSLENETLGLNEILAISATRYLVIERDGLEGKEAKFKRLFVIDTSRSSDVSKVDLLPLKRLPETIAPVSKKPFLDLLDPKWKLAGVDFPEKIEGLAFGPDLPDGRRLLIVTADNDFIDTKPLRIWAFAIEHADLPDFEPQQFDAK